MQISSKLKSFLILNRIYNLDKLTKLSFEFIASLRNYDHEIGEEISRLFYIDSRRDKKLSSTNKNNKIKPATSKTNMIISDQLKTFETQFDIILSTRLKNILLATGYHSNIAEFLSLEDDTLMSFKNFGSTTLDEVNNIRQVSQNKVPKEAETAKNSSMGVIRLANSKGEVITEIPKKSLDGPSKVILSNRLAHIIINLNYNSDITEFFSCDDKSLLEIKNFGKTTLKEVNDIRKLLNIETKTLYADYSAKIEIPAELLVLEFNKLFLIGSSVENLTTNVITKLQNTFKYISDLNGKTFNELLKNRGLGKKAIETIRSIIELIKKSSFSTIVQSLSSNPPFADVAISQIRCSFLCYEYLAKHRIKYLHQLYKIDSIDKSQLSTTERIVHLELRTIYYNNKIKSYETKINIDHGQKLNLPKDIDRFIESRLINNSIREAISYRWDLKGKKISLEEIAETKNLTRERIRQILQKAYDLFILLYIPEFKYYEDLFFNKALEQLSPIGFRNISAFTDKKFNFESSFYCAFLSDIFKSIPFEGNLISENRRDYKFIYQDIMSQTSIPNTATIRDILNSCPRNKKYQYLNILVSNDRYSFEKVGNNTYVNRKYYDITTLLKFYMAIEDRPLSLEEFIKYLNRTPYRKPNAYKFDLDSSSFSYLLNIIVRIDDFIRIERYKWALPSHLFYGAKEWPLIWNACQDVIKKLGHQADAGYLFRNIQSEFPNLNSKYELAAILNRAPGLTNLGFLAFALSETGQQERVTIEKVIREMFKKDWTPKHFDEIVKYLEKKRGFRREAIGLFHRQYDFIKLYPPAFYGMAAKDIENKVYLKNNIHYIESYLSYRRKDSTFIQDIMEDLEIEEPFEEFLSKLNKSENLNLLRIGQYSDTICLLNKNWGTIRILVSLLANFNKPMFFEELKLITKNELDLKFDASSVRYKLNSDKRIRMLEDGSYIYNNILEEKTEFLALLDEIEDFFLNNPQLVHIDDLYLMVCKLSENAVPDSMNDLLALISVDNRFSILNKTMVGLL